MHLTFDQITERRQQLANEHNLRYYADRDGGRMYGPHADEYNRLAAIHGKAPR